jgi:mannose-6-phosphate isomerase-like protein (cupin superfamily)
MSTHRHPRFWSLSCCAAAGLVALLVPRAVLGQTPAAPPLKSQVVRWEQAKSNTGDWGEMRRYFTGQTFATKDVLAAVAVVEPGKAVHKAHRHAEEEYLGIVEGSGVWSVDGKEVPAQRGDMLYAEPWVYHGLTNTGDKPLIFFVVRYNGKGVAVPPKPDDRPNELSGSGDAPKTVPIKGRVLFDGQPLAGASVTFMPEKGRPATGVTNAKGEYELTTFAKGDGAPPGVYKVSIKAQAAGQAAPGATAKGPPTGARPAIPAGYSDPATSPLRADVRPGPNAFDFNLR